MLGVPVLRIPPIALGCCRRNAHYRMRTDLTGCWLSVVALGVFTGLAGAATFTVTNANDAGPGSLRQVLFDANANPGADIVQFNIPGGGVHTIAPISSLPDITNAVTINGFSQPGSSPNTLANGNNAVLLIRLDGIGVTNTFPNGLSFNGVNNCSVRGLVIVRFSTGIQLYSSSGNTIAGNWIGLDVDNVSRGNTLLGVDVTGPSFTRSTNNLIGGTTPGDRNIISGNRSGLSFFPQSADRNTVQGNFIGTDATGTLPRGNQFEGVKVQSAGNLLIGGPSPGARNLICANGTGILMLGSSGNVIQGNYIGTDVSARYDLGNAGDGVFLQGTPFSTIGGPGAGNIIVNNAGYGIDLLGANTNIVQGNYIGTDFTGAWPLGNHKDGLYLQGSTGTTIGGQGAGQGNVIEFNGGAGVYVSSGSSNRISANSIFDNAGLGILLGATANLTQAPPVITFAQVAYSSTQVQGTLQTQPLNQYGLEFFASSAWDPSWIWEGQTYLGATTVATDGNGYASFSLTLPVAVPTDSVITATATDPGGNTSQFSGSAPLASGPSGVSLSLTRKSFTQITLSWPSAAAGFALQSTASLAPPIIWSAVTNAVSDNNTTRSCTVPTGAGDCRLFRLAR